jgi:hypothetical protein
MNQQPELNNFSQRVKKMITRNLSQMMTRNELILAVSSIGIAILSIALSSIM